MTPLALSTWTPRQLCALHAHLSQTSLWAHFLLLHTQEEEEDWGNEWFSQRLGEEREKENLSSMVPSAAWHSHSELVWGMADTSSLPAVVLPHSSLPGHSFWESEHHTHTHRRQAGGRRWAQLHQTTYRKNRLIVGCTAPSLGGFLRKSMPLFALPMPACVTPVASLCVPAFPLAEEEERGASSLPALS